MKKITETKLMNIVNKVLNEQKIRQFDEDEIGLLNFIFEREFKPPFREGKKDYRDLYPYYNRNNEIIGHLNSYREFTVTVSGAFKPNIEYKVCLAFEFSRDTWDWWHAIGPHLKSWMEGQLNIKIRYIY